MTSLSKIRLFSNRMLSILFAVTVMVCPETVTTNSWMALQDAGAGVQMGVIANKRPGGGSDGIEEAAVLFGAL
jgi:hypothetical protein